MKFIVGKKPKKGEYRMNKKMIITALAVVLSVSCASATDITGVTGVNGVYNIKPEHFSGNAGYRKYDNFKLDKGHVANLEFIRDGKANPDTFVNLVNNKVNINGLVNTTRNGNFYNGHAVFITPGGFVVGSSGVLNVGRLSVATPTQSTYNNMLNGYGSKDYNYAANIGRNISALTQNSKGNAGAADITIQGKVFARNGVEMTGKNVAVPGNIINGVKAESVLTTDDQANQLFNALVNTNGIMKDSASDAYTNRFVANGSRVLVKSTAGMSVSGSVDNGAGNVYLTNNGSDGLNVSGVSDAHGLNRLYSTKGNLSVNSDSTVYSRTGDVVVQNKGGDLTLTKNTYVISRKGNTEVYNQGTGRLVATGTIGAGGDESVQGGKTGHVSVINQTGSGMTVGGYVYSGLNKNQDSSELAIHNFKGDMIVDGKVANEFGNVGIINEGSGMTITKNSTILNAGKTKIANTGTNGMTIVGDVDNIGELRIYNDNGKLTFGTDSTGNKAAQIKNEQGKLYIAARKDSTGIVQSTKSNITNAGGNLVIRNSGTKVAQGARGLDLQGGVKNTNGTVSINNDFGDMYVSSNIDVKNGNLGVINRKNGQEMTVASAGKINVDGGNINIKNYGQGNMAVNSEISHNGRVNVLANAGSLTLGSTVHNNSGALGDNGGFYAAARSKGTGVNVTSSFVVDGNGEVLIKNISGSEGLRYAGNINTNGYQAALVNKQGDMNVSGSVKTTEAPIIISNQGRQLTVTSSANLNSGKTGNLFDNGSVAPSISKNATLVNMEGHGTLYKQEL